MRTICDVCESAPAILFCAADEAALCRSCDDKVHRCNKLASRHVRVGLADPSEVPRCDICENAPAFFYCGIDGSSLCLQCDMIVHVGGKRTHGRYLMLRQRVEFPGDKPSNDPTSQPMDVADNHEQNHVSKQTVKDKILTNGVPSVAMLDGNTDDTGIMDPKMIDLNARPRRPYGQSSNAQIQGPDGLKSQQK